MRRYLVALLLIISVIASTAAPVTHAATLELKNKGLYISPVRSYVSLPAGQTVTRSFRVANLTEKPMTVSISVEKFSVADYAYDFQFSRLDNDWIQPVEKQFTLKPLEGREVPYRVAIPQKAPAGGQYYTLYASADLLEAGLEGTVRATTLLYLTVDGTLTRTSQIVGSELFPIVIGPQIPYKIDVKNTGNIHYFAYFLASVDGLFYHQEPTGTSSLLMPGTTRHAEHTVKAPPLPGIYKVTYGYNPDQGDPVRVAQYILFVPPWSIVVFAIIAVVAIKYFNRRRNSVTRS